MAMPIYNLSIKSHTDLPDFEATCVASSFDEAETIFKKKLGGDWDTVNLQPFIEETNICQVCGNTEETGACNLCKLD